MKTDELIAALARYPTPVDPARSQRTLLWAVLGGALGGLALLVGTLGLSPALRVEAASAPMFWLRLAFVASTALLGWALLRRLAQPNRSAGWPAALLGLPAAIVWLVALVSLASAGAVEHGSLWLGTSWLACPFRIAAYSLPAFVLLMVALRSLAPTRLRQAGAAAGLAAGAVGACVYQLYCPELAAAFIGTWYVLGMLIPAAVGAWAGPRMLRW